MALFPYDDILVDDLTIASNVAVVTSESRSKQFLVRRTVGQRYEFAMACRVLPSAFWRANAYLTSLRAGATVTELSLPYYGESTATAKTTASTAAIGVRSALLTSVIGLQPGLFFQFAGHSKLYCVTAITSNTISFEPNLVRSVAAGEQLNFNNLTISCRLNGSMPAISSSGHRVPVSFNLNFVEAIS